MLINLNVLKRELPALADCPVQEVRDLLASLGFPVDGTETVRGESILEVDVTANRGDVLSHRGLARDLAAKLDAGLTPLALEGRENGEALFPIRIESEACTTFSSALLEIEQPHGTPDGVKQFLASLGTSAKNLAPVDASNELLHMYGHPTHAYDAAQLRGTVVVRWAKDGETLVTLDGISRTCTSLDLVIADDSGPIGLAGVMGGESTKVTESTRTVLLESAWFDSRVVRAMAHRHGLHTDASYRFGRGADSAMPSIARTLLAERLMKWCGGSLKGMWTVGGGEKARQEIHLPCATVRRIAGAEIPIDRCQGHLERLGCRVERFADGWQVKAPSWRHDLAIPEDFAEEVLRMEGYETISTALPPTQGAPQPLSLAYQRRRSLAKRLANLGFFQAVTLGFVSPEEDARYLEKFGNGLNSSEGRTLGNPLGLEYSVMRASLVPSLLRMAETNLRQGAREVRLFEMGPVFQSAPAGPVEIPTLAFIWGGELGGEDYLSPARKVQPADLIATARDLGCTGEISVHDMGEGLLAVEIPLEELPAPDDRIIPRFQAFSRYPSVSRDLSLLVGLDQAYRPLVDAMTAEVGRTELRELRCVDVFRSKHLPEGQQAWLLRFRFQADDRTLTGEEVDGWVASALGAARACGATLRG